MKGKSIVIAALTAILSIAAASDTYQAQLSLKAERQALADLGVASSEPGNAAEVYAPYLKSEKPIIKENWLKDLAIPQILHPESKDLAAVKAAVVKARADLDALVAASRKSDYALYGTFYKPNPNQHPMLDDVLEYVPFTKVALLLIQDAKDTADPKAAEEKLLALARIGQQFENDATTFGFSLGNIMKKHAGNALADLYAGQGKAELAEKWKKQAVSDEARAKTIRLVGAAAGAWDEAAVTALVRNPDLPISLKIQVIIMQHYCGTSQAKMAQCKVLGAPGWVKKLEAEMKDPQAQVFFALLKNDLTWKEIEQYNQDF